MSKAYNVPEWAALDMNDIVKHDYNLEIMKDGVIIDRIELNNMNKSYYILGRQPDIVDIQMDHPSISRQHAVLQFRNDNAVMIMDWQSAQGTFVNKIQLQKDLYQRLYVGDMIKFGCSTRMYILNGPDDHTREEYDSIGMQQYREKLVDHSNKTKDKLKDGGALWGFTEDAQQEDDDEYDHKEGKDSKEKDLPAYIKNDKNYDRKYADKFNVDLDETELNEKDNQLLEKIRTKERKIQNMQEENRRIYMKEGQDGGLTENQLKTVSRNDEHINQLMEQIEVLVAQIKDKNLQRQKQASISKTNDSKDNGDDNDDIRDTTNETADQGTNWRLRKKLAKSSLIPSSVSEKRDGYSYDDLCKEKASLEVLLTDLQNQINNTNNIINNNKINDNEADIETYIKKSNVNEAIAKLKVLEDSFNDITHKLKGIESLIKIAAPALPSLAKKLNKETVSTQAISLVAETMKSEIEDKIDSNKDDDNIESNNNPNKDNNNNNNIPVKVSNRSSKKENYAIQSLSSLMEFIETEKRNNNQTDSEETSTKRSRESEVLEPQKKLKGPIGPSRPQDNEFTEDLKSDKKIDNSYSIPNDAEITWKPPANQDGSGKTNLNEKYGY